MSIITLEARSPVDHFMGVRPQKDKEEFPYGWRYVIKKQPNGEETYYEVPLTAEDLLDPQIGDQMVQHTKHYRSNLNLFEMFDNHYADEPTVGVFGDLKMIWGIKGLKELNAISWQQTYA